jgi:hypothetical protein
MLAVAASGRIPARWRESELTVENWKRSTMEISRFSALCNFDWTAATVRE